MTQLERIAAFVCGSTMGAMSAAHRARLRLHAADAAVALLAASASPEGLHLRALRQRGSDFGGEVALAAALIRSAETDDIHLAACVTPTSIALPAAAFTGAPDAATAENALRIAVELGVRLGAAISGPTALYRGVWPTCFVAPMAVAAATARARGLNERQTAHALSLALMMSSGRGGRFVSEPSGRWILMMGAVAVALKAVDAAACGFCGDLSLLDGPWLRNAVGGEPDISALTKDLDRCSAMKGLGLKPFSTARQALAPVQALLELINEGLDPAAVDRIEVFAPQAFASMISRPLEPLRTSSYVNVGFQMALAALRPEGLFDLDRADAMVDPALCAFAERVRVAPEPALDTLYPAAWPGEICVYAGRERFRRRIEVAHGDAAQPLSPDDLRLKTCSLLRPVMSAAQAEGLFNILIEAFETDRGFAAAVSLMRASMAGSLAR